MPQQLLVIALGVLIVATGVSLWSVPAGLIVLGLEVAGVGVLMLEVKPPRGTAPNREDGEA